MRLARASLIALSAAALALGGTARADDGHDFIVEAKALYRVAACGSTDPLPKALDAKVIAAHCHSLERGIKRYKNIWLSRAAPFLAGVVPKDAPDKVVYPFGGGDLLSALATYPNAQEYTTLSLERAGDPRGLDHVTAEQLPLLLEQIRRKFTHIFFIGHSLTTDLGSMSRGELPGQVVFALLAMQVHELEPVSLRYFHLDAQGNIQYVTDAEIAAADKLEGKEKKRPFAFMELQFRKKGETALRVHRHLGFNLDDKHLAADPSVIKYLEQKGRVAAMTKAASFLLWWDEFSTIRNYLLSHMDVMISDATGIPPRFAKKAGYTQETYGHFDGPLLPKAGKRETAEFVALWSGQPERALPFRYGYPDAAKHSHLLVTKKSAP